jgi:hypothetical protein
MSAFQAPQFKNIVSLRKMLWKPLQPEIAGRILRPAIVFPLDSELGNPGLCLSNACCNSLLISSHLCLYRFVEPLSSLIHARLVRLLELSQNLHAPLQHIGYNGAHMRILREGYAQPLAGAFGPGAADEPR